MSKTRNTLAGIGENLDESLGVRRYQSPSAPQLSPSARSQDADRRPLRNVGKVAIDKVTPDPDQPREEFTDEALQRLAESIREQGQLSPIHVRWSSELDSWMIISGERRWRATKRAGLATINCVFHEEEMTSSEILEQQLIENCLREDLQPIEEARAFAKLMEVNDWSGRQLADALRVDPSKVSRVLALLKLPVNLQSQIAAGTLSARAGYELSRLKNSESQTQVASSAKSGTLTHQKAANEVRRRQGRRNPKSRRTSQTFVTEEGWKIVVSSRRTGTYHDIAAALQEALDDVNHRIHNNMRLF